MLNLKSTILINLLLILSFSFASKLPHPLDFKGTDAEKKVVIKYIKEYVKETYTAIGMGDAITLRMMEEENLNSFKELTKVKDRKLLDQVIQTYCEIGMCDYITILMMYEESLRATQKKLEW